MILKDIWLDVKAVQERDPAARSALEVLLLYQGVHALIWHRFAHWFYKHHMFFIARWISQVARFFTLIEIHPGAPLGHGILIDHGCGVVIGETGPGAFITYAICGFLVIMVMRMLAEMAVANPSTGSFADYARQALGNWAGFSVGCGAAADARTAAATALWTSGWKTLGMM